MLNVVTENNMEFSVFDYLKFVTSYILKNTCLRVPLMNILPFGQPNGLLDKIISQTKLRHNKRVLLRELCLFLIYNYIFVNNFCCNASVLLSFIVQSYKNSVLWQLLFA